MKIQAVRGMQDILPAQKANFRLIEDTARQVLAAYGYQEIGLPVIEQTDLFKRLVGEHTDIVEKEMYTFPDRNEESLTLRPEGTAGCVRFAEENGLLFNQIQRLWYAGPMFRYERPQKGRYRQFDQIGVECFGMAGPEIDAELLLLNARLWRELGVEQDVRLELNSLGDSAARGRFRDELVAYLSRYENDLDEDSRRRLTTNPLRILDSKSERTKEILGEAPALSDYLDNESKAHFETLQQLLGDSGIDFVVNPNTVRGLDYYNRTVFEWITDTLGAQGTVCGGGRYDTLVEQLGGKPSPGVGFAMGLDRLALMLAGRSESSGNIDVYVVSVGNKPRQTALRLAESLRDGVTGIAVVTHCGDGKMKSQMKKADASGASIALIIGDDEVSEGTVTIKSLREEGEQVRVAQDVMVDECARRLGKEK